MTRGSVWWVCFDPSVGGEIRKTRPAVIMNNDTANRFLNRVQIVPLTSNVSRLYPGESFVVMNGKQHKAMADQLMTVSKRRLIERIDALSPSDIQAVEHAIQVQLALRA